MHFAKSNSDVEFRKLNPMFGVLMSSIVQLGRLERVSLREAWPNEASNFTPWLAEERNLLELGEAIGLPLELESVEKQVGSFSADILARDAITKQWVLIENQIAPTDHSHLGQLLTYAAGLDARTVIWIAESFRDEHRAAIDFLNRATVEDFSFFAIQIELWKIGTSSFAPKFSIVAKPNEWNKQGQAAKQVSDGELSQNQQMYREFWTSVIARAKTVFPALGARQPYKANWQIGEKLKGGDPSLDCNAAFTWDRGLRCEIWIDGSLAKAAFKSLREKSAEIETRLGQQLSWEELPESRGSRIALYKPGQDKCADRTKWPSQQEWLVTWWPKMADTFKPFVKAIDFSQLSNNADGPPSL